jgi:hypothetical protein
VEEKWSVYLSHGIGKGIKNLIYEHKLLVFQYLPLEVFQPHGNFTFVVGCLNIFMDEIQMLEAHLVFFHSKLLVPRYKTPIDFWKGL